MGDRLGIPGAVDIFSFFVASSYLFGQISKRHLFSICIRKFCFEHGESFARKFYRHTSSYSRPGRTRTFSISCFYFVIFCIWRPKTENRVRKKTISAISLQVFICGPPNSRKSLFGPSWTTTLIVELIVTMFQCNLILGPCFHFPKTLETRPTA